MNKNIIKFEETEFLNKFNDNNRVILDRLLKYRNIHAYVEKLVINSDEFTEKNILFQLKNKFPKEFLYCEGENKRDKHFKELLLKGKPKYQSLGIGIMNNTFYFGNVIDGDKNLIISSNKDKFVAWDLNNDEIKDKFGLNYKFSLFDTAIENMWDLEGSYSILEWLFKDIETINTTDLFNEIRSINKYYIEHYNEAIHDYIACDILSNYVYPIFEAKGRTYFQADYGSGKSKQATIYKLLSFNSLMAGSITPASFERIIESTGGTIIVDNLDNMSDDHKKANYQVIEVYYKKGGKTIKADGEKNKPTTYEGYSPMVINNIIGLPEVTQSRCNTLIMLRTDNKELSKRKIIETDEKWRILKNKLHIWALQHWKEIQKKYYELDDEDLSNRDFEKAVAVLTIASLINNEVYENIKKYLIDIGKQQKIKDLDNNWEFITFQILFELLNKEEKEEKRVLVRDISYIAKERLNLLNDETLKFSHYVGKVLSTYPQLFKKTYHHGNAGYNIKKENLWKAIKLKGYDEVLNQQTKNNSFVMNETLDTKEISIDVSNSAGCQK